MTDKRSSERVPILGELQGEMMVFQPMLLRDLSRGGVTVETRFPLHLDSLHDIRLTLGDTSIVLKGRVIHSRISEVDHDVVMYRTGMEFVDVTERAAKVVSDFLETVKADRTGV